MKSLKPRRRKKTVRSKIRVSERAQHAQQEHHHGRLWMRILFVLLAVSFVVICGYALLFSPFTRLTYVHVRGAQTLSAGDMSAYVHEYVSGRALAYIPRDRFVMISADAIAASLQERFRRIEDVQVVKKFPHNIDVTITERESVMVWCRDAQRSDCYMMDRRGELYAPADFNSDEIIQNNLVTIVDRSGRGVALSETILRPHAIDHILAHRDFFADFDVFDSEDALAMHSRVSGELIISTREGWDVLIDLRQEPRDVHRAIETFFKKITFAQQQKDDTEENEEADDQNTDNAEDEDNQNSEEDGEEIIIEETDEQTHNKRLRTDLEYVDFRISEKVFYKFKETEEEREAREKAQKEAEENEGGGDVEDTEESGADTVTN